MFAMSVTLDVLKLSGWLNTSAVCVIERKACEAGSMRGARVRGAVEVQGACEGPKGNQGGRGTGGAHRKHVRHVCDSRRVEAQRLVERLQSLPSRKEGIQSVWAR